MDKNSCLSLPNYLSKHAHIKPDFKAFTFLGNGEDVSATYTYSELNCDTQRLAQQLLNITQPNERALLVYPAGLDFIPAFLACLSVGVIAVPINAPRNARSMEPLFRVVADAKPSVIMCDQRMYDVLNTSVDTALNSTPIKYFVTDRFLNSGQSEGMAKSDGQGSEVDVDQLAFLQYTSGSTASPKGVMISHGNLLSNMQMIERSFAANQHSVGVGWLPHYHDMGLVANILQPIYLGMHTVRMPPAAFIQKPLRWLKAISQYGGTHCGGPNFAYDLCVQKISGDNLPDLDLSNWSLAFTGAEPVRAETLRHFTNKFADSGFEAKSFYPCYGMAESTVFITGGQANELPQLCPVDKQQLKQNRFEPLSIENSDSQQLVGCGFTWMDQSTVIVNPNTLEECRQGEIGEIWVNGSSIGQGYWRKPEISQQMFKARMVTDQREFLRTGDLGYIHQGQLYITGRLKELLIVRGKNYYPQDIELTVESCNAALKKHAGAVFSIDERGTDKVIVLQEVKRTSLKNYNAEEIFQQIRQDVAAVHELKVDEIYLLKPGIVKKTSSGKIQRQRMKIEFENQTLEALAQWPRPQSDNEDSIQVSSNASIPFHTHTVQQIEEWLIQRIEAVIDDPSVSIRADIPIERYGLDSIQAVDITADLETWLNREVSPTIIYNYPTIRGLSEYLAQESSVTTTQSQNSNHSKSIGDYRDNDIAIIGMACRFPGADNLAEFWKLLNAGTDAISVVPDDRWNNDRLYDQEPGELGKMNTRWGGFLKNIDQFDADFFGISPREARKMDPQQRLVLEVAYHALQNAGIPEAHIRGSLTGVYMGVSHSNYQKQLTQDLRDVDAYSVSGTALSIVANRLSYLFDLRGPSMSIDTACSSSLVAVHLASQGLRQGEINTAIVGGVNLILSPEGTVSFSQARMMSSDGRCKTFSAQADGYSRGEGCGIVILKRMADAVRDGDDIRAVIRGSAINQDGLSNGMTAPNGPSQEQVIERALHSADVSADDISYVEAHGTGTSLGDPIELNSLKKALNSHKKGRSRCAVGSVKTNIGHLESAAGIAGLIKVVLALQHQRLPAHLHLSQLNPLIDLNNSAVFIPTKSQQWECSQTLRHAGVSSFGFGGTNAHVILQEVQPNLSIYKDLAMNLFTVSAKTSESLQGLVQEYIDYILSDTSSTITDICVTAALGRTHFEEHRVAIVVRDKKELTEKLQGYLNNQTVDGLYVRQNKELDDSELSPGLNLKALLNLHPKSLYTELCEIAQEYCLGRRIQWGRFLKGVLYTPAKLPTYVFDRQSHWFTSVYDQSRPEDAQSTNIEHNEFTELLLKGDSKGVTEWLEANSNLGHDDRRALPAVLKTILDGIQTQKLNNEGHQETDQNGELLKRLLAASDDKRKTMLTVYIQGIIEDALEIAPLELDIYQDLNELGIDSIMAMELRSKVNEDLQVNVHILELLVEDTSVDSFADYVLDLMKHKFTNPEEADPKNTLTSANEQQAATVTDEIESADSQGIIDKLDQMDENEIDAMLKSMLASEDSSE